MTGALPIIPVDRRLTDRRGIKTVIFGKSGAGKTSRLAELANALPLIMFLPLDSGDGSPEPEVRS
jgi:signal recognition particle receptor subunit beta